MKYEMEFLCKECEKSRSGSPSSWKKEGKYEYPICYWCDNKDKKEFELLKEVSSLLELSHWVTNKIERKIKTIEKQIA